VNRLRGEGYARFDAILEAGRHRFRPILMTALTTIFGLMPMAIGKSSLIGIPYAPLGRTMIGGLITSTFLTLFVVPLFYTYFDGAGDVAGGLSPLR
jgi:HAE1 family hydrophobic/amphiphilic exporter-1